MWLQKAEEGAQTSNYLSFLTPNKDTSLLFAVIFIKATLKNAYEWFRKSLIFCLVWNKTEKCNSKCSACGTLGIKSNLYVTCLILSQYPIWTHTLFIILWLTQRCWRQTVQIRSLFMSDIGSQGPEHNMSTALESLKSDFGIHSPPSPQSSLEAGAAPAPHPHLNIHLRCWTYAHAGSQYSIRAVRRTRPHAIFIYVMQMKALKLKRTFEELPDDVFSCINTQAAQLMLPWFFFLTFSVGRVVFIGRLMVTKGYGSPPSLAPGTAWRFWLVDCEKMSFKGGWWHFHWACQINNSNELSSDKGHNNTHLHTHRDKGKGKESMFLLSPDPEVVHQSCTDLCVTLGFSELLQLFDVSNVRKENVVWISLYYFCSTKCMNPHKMTLKSNI